MREYREYRILIGFNRSAKDIFDEIESVSARFFREGWSLESTVLEELLEYVDLLFVRTIFMDDI